MAGCFSKWWVASIAFGFGTVLCASAAATGENAKRRCWTLTPKAQAIVEEMRGLAKRYSPRTDRTRIFSRAQLKYGAQRTDFIHRWYDRPLHQDSTWAETANPDKILHPEAWKRTVEAVNLGGMDGLAVCTGLSRCNEVIGMSVTPGGEMQILVELPYAYADKGIESHVKIAEQALNMPNAYRIDGKVVLTRYPPIKDSELDFVEKLRTTLDERFGPDRFIVVFYVTAFEKRLSEGPLTAEVLEWAREHLRRCLRKMDGIFMAGWEVYWPRRYGAEFERDVLVPLYQSVLSEPEFAGKKYLGMPVHAGHENCYRWSYDIDSQGTRTLVERMRTMQMLRPDFIICCEWDEENENTFFRPTVANGYVHQRITRYFADRFAGVELSPFPDDDVSVPNMVVSYRRSLIAGEPIEVEVRNIPDGTFRGKKIECAFCWKDVCGNTVKSYPSASLAADSIDCVSFVSQSTELVGNNRFLIPELRIKVDGRSFVFGEGFWPLDLNATRAVDAKWVKHSLRERPKGVTGSIKCTLADQTGEVEVIGSFSSGEPVKSVEVLQEPDTVFMYDPSNLPCADGVVLKITMQARGNAPRSLALNGDIRIVNAKGLKLISGKNRMRTMLPDGWRLKNSLYCNWDVSLFASIPKSEVETAEIVTDLSPSFGKMRIKVKDVVEKEVIGVSGPAGGNFVVRHHLSQISIPKPCNVKNGSFSFRIKPLGKSDVLRMRIIDSKERVWRGSPLTIGEPTGNLRRFHVFERDEGRVTEIAIDSSRVDEPKYDFSRNRGSVVWTSSGRHLSGILGGAATLVTGFGQGESNYGDTLTRYITNDIADALDNAPKHVKGPGETFALEFDGSDYLMLPQQLAPKFSGFEISIDVCPEHLEGRQSLVDAGYAAYWLFLREGVPEARMWGAPKNAKAKAALKAGEWSNVRVVFDQRTFKVVVNGVEGEPVQHSGCQFQARYTSVGAANRTLFFFRGRLANLSFNLK
ncbi:MAG: hypothetical protein E7046_09220 [Lentisphaerae bacterium]|nr:hypothetical protein [Lentisphaerota bacterium]